VPHVNHPPRAPFPDFTALKAALGACEHRPWCAALLPLGCDPEMAADIEAAACTCGLASARERAERIEGMGLDAGRKAN
jgi:hypothetical protein